MRISVMLSQIQPHFLYNALTTIKGLCATDPPQAEKAVDSFSLFLRGNMNSLTARRPIPFSQELTHCRNYLELEQKKKELENRISFALQAGKFEEAGKYCDDLEQIINQM